jgi:hypothetical protein
MKEDGILNTSRKPFSHRYSAGICGLRIKHNFSPIIQIRFTATFVELFFFFLLRFIGNFVKPPRKNILGLRYSWFCFFFGKR